MPPVCLTGVKDMIRGLVVGAMLLGLAAPASAAKIVSQELVVRGEVYGTVTSGTAHYWWTDGFPIPDDILIDLSGYGITISFDIYYVTDVIDPNPRDWGFFPGLAGTFTYQFTPSDLPYPIGDNRLRRGYEPIQYGGSWSSTQFEGSANIGEMMMYAPHLNDTRWQSAILNLNYSDASSYWGIMAGTGTLRNDNIESTIFHHLFLDFVIESGWVQGVPEPSTWAMLIAGFGLVGAAARRRKDRMPAARF